MAEESVEGQLNSNGNRRGMHPNSRKNLNPENGFKPGKSGNPKGGPRKEQSITMLAREMLDQEAEERYLHPSDYGKQMTWKQAIAKSLIVFAVKGEGWALKELLERLEGKVTQPISGQDGGPIQYEINVKDQESAKLTERIIGGAMVSNIGLS